MLAWSFSVIFEFYKHMQTKHKLHSMHNHFPHSLIRHTNVGLQGRKHSKIFLCYEHGIVHLACFLSSDVTALLSFPFMGEWKVDHKAGAIPLLDCSFTVCQWKWCAWVMKRTLNVMAEKNSPRPVSHLFVEQWNVLWEMGMGGMWGVRDVVLISE